MKKYTLSAKTFSEVSELYETITYLRVVLPNYASKHLDDYFASSLQHHDSEENDTREQLSMMIIFEEYFEKEFSKDNVFKYVNEAAREGTTRQETQSYEQKALIKHYCIPENEILLIDHTLNLEALVHKGVLVVIESVELQISKHDLEMIAVILNATMDRTIEISNSDNESRVTVNKTQPTDKYDINKTLHYSYKDIRNVISEITDKIN